MSQSNVTDLFYMGGECIRFQMLSRAKVFPILEIKHIESGYIQLVASPIGFTFSLNIAGLPSLIGFNF